MSRPSRSLGAQIRAGLPSDPTARAAILLAEMPEGTALKQKWCNAIEDAWAECVAQDAVNKNGMAFFMENVFSLTEEPDADENSVRDKVCAHCNIAIPTYYNWMKTVTQIVVYHAAKRGLL